MALMFSKKSAVMEPVSMSREPETVDIPAKTCPDCGKFHRRTGAICAACEYKALVESEPKQSPDRHPCGICGVTHIAGEWVKKPISVSNKPRHVWLCAACAEIKARNLAPAHGTDENELILSLRVLQEYGYAQPWRKRGADSWLRKTIVRDVLAIEYDQRPKIAAELASWGPTDEMRDACRYLKLNLATLARHMGTTPHQARALGHQHEPRTIDHLLWDAQVLAQGDPGPELSTWERAQSYVPMAEQLRRANQ